MQSLIILERQARSSKGTLTIKVNARETRVRYGFGRSPRRGEELSSPSEPLEALLAVLASRVGLGGGTDGA